MIFARLLALFILIPIIELFLLLEIGQLIGTGYTLLLIVVTGFVGAFLAKSQGLAVLGRIKHQLAVGEMPASAVADGFMIVVAGALLMTPGILTDVVGFSLLVPGIRAVIRRVVMNWVMRKISDGDIVFTARNREP